MSEPSQLRHHINCVTLIIGAGTAVFGLVLGGVALAMEPSPPREKPNIVLFITDDESWLERSAYGWSKLPTPGFDRVAQQGVLFTHAYASAPSCAPSRASVLTGRNFWELKQGAYIQAWLPREFPVLTEALEHAGYLVGRTGKGWGPGVHPEGAHGPEMAGRAYETCKVPKPTPGVAATDYAANFKRFLEKRERGQPFFFWAGTQEPHEPWDGNNYHRLEREFGMSLDEISMPPWLEDTPEQRKKRANFLYEICYADRHLSRMLDHLESAGELENTLVIVTSDNGTPLVKGKASPYEWGVREPFAVMWPARVPKGRTVTDFVNFADIAPTLLEALGVKVPAGMSGRSFLDVLTSTKSGRVDASRHFTVTGIEWHGEFDPVRRSARTLHTDRYAYIARYANDDNGEAGQACKVSKAELYDLQSDPWQETDLSAMPEHAETKERLARQLLEYGRRTGDPRMTGDMRIFRETRRFVQQRKQEGYGRSQRSGNHDAVPDN